MRNNIFLLALLVLFGCSQLSKKNQKEELLNKGRTIHQNFMNGQTISVWRSFTDEMKLLFKNYENFENFRKEFLSKVGGENKVIEELAYPSLVLHSLYYRKVTFEKTQNTSLTIQWAFDSEGKTSGLTLKNLPYPAYSPYLKYQDKNNYAFPIDGNGYIVWGGSRIEENYHVVAPNQRFAYDIVVTDGKRTHILDAKQNADYFCFDRNVLASASGTVVIAHDGVADNVPGKMNQHQLLGNYVIIDHGNNEFGFYAHLKKGTVNVNPGQKLDSKTVIGKCGNSGHSSEPHLHFHLQNSSDFQKGLGLPVQFKNVKVNGEVFDSHSPVLGNIVSRE